MMHVPCSFHAWLSAYVPPGGAAGASFRSPRAKPSVTASLACPVQKSATCPASDIEETSTQECLQELCRNLTSGIGFNSACLATRQKRMALGRHRAAANGIANAKLRKNFLSSEKNGSGARAKLLRMVLREIKEGVIL